MPLTSIPTNSGRGASEALMMLAGFAPGRTTFAPRVLWAALATTCLLSATASTAAQVAPSLVPARDPNGAVPRAQPSRPGSGRETSVLHWSDRDVPLRL